MISSRLWNGATSRPASSFVIGPKPRILILSASVGAGHTRAAQAVESALSALSPDAKVTHVDVLRLTNAAFRHVYNAGYFHAVKVAPRLVGWMYDMLDRPGHGDAMTRARLAFERFNFRPLVELLTQQPWDLVINTHFLPAALVGWLSQNKKIACPQATVVTDFDVHGMWLNHPCERYFVATQEAAANIAATGVSRSRIEVTGIPIDSLFGVRRDRGEIIRGLGLTPDRPIVLHMAGGFGIGSTQRIHQSICDVQSPLQIVAVAGKNAEAERALERMPKPSKHHRTILGFTNQMHELLRAADVVVSKPGGLTTSESLASGCPMVIAEPIPGQEERNSDFLLENGCAIKVNNLACLTYKLETLLADQSRLASMREAASRCAKPRAAFDIAASCLALVGSQTRRQRFPGIPAPEFRTQIMAERSIH